MSTVLRVGRHEATESHTNALRAAYGEDVKITPPLDVQYGSDPVAAVQAVIDRHEDVAAVEASGPEPVLMKLVEGLTIPVIRPVFRREGSRVVVVGKDASGRDIFDVERYETLAIENRPSLVGKSID
jgi:hypothetical protein